MLTQFTNNLRLTWRQVFHPIIEPEPQIPLSWARRIGAYEAVPEGYREFFEPLQKAGQGFPYCVLTPSFEGFLHPSTEKLICQLDGGIHILERRGSSLRDTCYPLAEISFVEHRKVLLDSYIKISGLNKQGTPESSTLRFNTATEELFSPLLARLRGGSMEKQAQGRFTDLGRIQTWMKVNYQFMMLARRSLLDDEKAFFFHLQPEIRKPVLRILGKMFHRIVCPTHAVILAEREIILIREEGYYGSLRDYLPLNKVEGIILEEKGKGLVELSIAMKAGNRFSVLYPMIAKDEIQEFVEKCQESISAQ